MPSWRAETNSVRSAGVSQPRTETNLFVAQPIGRAVEASEIDLFGFLPVGPAADRHSVAELEGKLRYADLVEFVEVVHLQAPDLVDAGRSGHPDQQEGMGIGEVVFLDHALSTDVATLVIIAQGMVRLRGGCEQDERQDRSGPLPHVSSPPSRCR